MKEKVRLLYRRFKFHIPGYLKYGLWGRIFWNTRIGKFPVIGKNVKFEKNFKAGDCLHVGHHSYIGPNVEIGHFALISHYVHVIGNDHVFRTVGVPTILSGRPEDYENLKTVIGDDVWIGHGVTIMRGLRIGEGSVIASNSVVTKDIEKYTVNAGVPSKSIGKRFDEKGEVVHSKFLEKYRNGYYKLDHDTKPCFKDLMT